MNITVNGEPREVPAETTIEELLASLERGDEALAVAVNLHVVSRDTFAERSLVPEDRVDIVTAVGGG